MLTSQLHSFSTEEREWRGKSTIRFTTLGAHSETMSFRSKHKHTPYASLPVSRDGSGANRESG